MEKFNTKLLKLSPSKIREFNNLAIENNAKVYMTLGEPDFKTPEVIKKACIDSIKENNTKYSHTYGSYDLRKAIMEYEKKQNNIDYTTDEILITTGSTEAITATLFAILNPNDEVIIPTPCYPLYNSIVEYQEAKMIRLDTSNNNFQIDTKMLKDKITSNTKAILLTSPNNPTGTIYNEETLQTIYDLVKGTNIFVILDECYELLIYESKFVSFSKYKDIKDQIIICKSFSKPYAMTGFRVGYLMGGKEFITQAAKMHQYMVVTSNSFVSDAAIVALKTCVKPFVDIYKTRRDYIYERLIHMGLDVIKPDGAFYVFPSIKKYKMGSWEFCLNLLKTKKLALIPGICFEADDYVRISYCVSLETIKIACDLLEEYLKEIE
ncbi:MAG: pyridoxal phosphate-dependent aminotransferase [Anaeroplasmataceae bacterium]